jgi:hypothetical protein
MEGRGVKLGLGVRVWVGVTGNVATRHPNTLGED